MKGFQMPFVCVLGNHDCLGTGEDVYKAIYGNPNFAFTAGNVRFICLNTNAMEYDYSQPVPDFGFMEDELTNLPEGIEKTVFLMHVKPYEFIFNNNVAVSISGICKAVPQCTVLPLWTRTSTDSRRFIRRRNSLLSMS